MCRLVAYLGRPLSPAPLVFGGEHSLYRQSWSPDELLVGSVNADGYGVVWYAEGRPARIAEARPIWYDEGLETTLEVLDSACVFAALRNGTPGIPVDRSGLLPLLQDGWAFGLNGFVPDFRRSHMRALRSELSDELYATLDGSSDSETLFLLTLEALRSGATPVEALTTTVDRVLARIADGVEAQLVMVLTDGRRLAAVRTGSVDATNSLYVSHRPVFAPGGVVLASEPTHPEATWEPVDGHGWIAVDADGTVRTGKV